MSASQLNLDPEEKAALTFVLVEWLEKEKAETHILYVEVLNTYQQVVKL